jgi:hypothetical protein
MFSTLKLVWYSAMLAMGVSWAAPVKLEASGETKRQSVFFPKETTDVLQANLKRNPAAQAQARACLEAAQVWLEKSDDELWSAMFGATLRRSWMVWSNGFCPSCRKDVPMYGWKIDGLRQPWKAACPHCHEMFPKNDFARFYRSGLDVHGVFAPERADRTLLFNAEHPGADDPLRSFGVDDGTGYHDGVHRWHFVSAYLIYGQWKQVIMSGIRTLAMSYVLTGEPRYAHKAVILLDRVADLYPSFDFLTQGISYEKADPIVGAGMVTVWHDACRETMELALAYDMIFPALAEDRAAVDFLATKAATYLLANPKKSMADIQRNIEDGILRHALRQPEKIFSNFPNTDTTLLINQAVLDWPRNRPALLDALQTTLARATAVDGLSGEKGLGAYSTFAPRSMANVLALFDRLAPDLLATLVERVPSVKQLFLFHVDTWLGESYYPKIGDAGAFGVKDLMYAGAAFSRFAFDPALGGIPFVSDFTLFGKLYEITGDPTYVKLLYRANQRSVTDLPYDLLHQDSPAFQAMVTRVIEQKGAALHPVSVNKSEWGLAILRSGSGDRERGVWLDYDIGGNHGRGDGMNVGLYAHGLELLSGFGYPPVQFGGWHSPRANWYKMTAAHNTVVVDGKNQLADFGQPETDPLSLQLEPRKKQVLGKITAWADGQHTQWVRAAGTALVQTSELKTYERSLVLIDISPADSYVLDIFRVTGGQEHTRFLHGYFGAASATGLNLAPVADFGHNVQMRNFRGGPAAPGWHLDWKAEDRYGYLPAGQTVHLRTTDLTRGAHASLAESWLMYPEKGVSQEAWVPSLLIRRTAPTTAPLQSTFVAVLEPYAGETKLGEITRLDLQMPSGAVADDSHIAVRVKHADGKMDLIMAAPATNSAHASKLVQPDWAVTTDSSLCLLRRDAAGHIEYLFMSGGTVLQCGGFQVEPDASAGLFEAEIKNGKLVVLRGAIRSSTKARP